MIRLSDSAIISNMVMIMHRVQSFSSVLTVMLLRLSMDLQVVRFRGSGRVTNS